MNSLKLKISGLILITLLMFSCKDEPVVPTGGTFEINEDITVPEVWKTGSIYIVKDVIRVSANLTIEPGTVIKFADGAYLDIAYWNGEVVTLLARGTSDKPIVFTSASPMPAAGDHNGVNLYAGARNCEFEFCVFEYGGKSDYYQGSLYIEDAKVKVNNCTFRHAKNDAVIVVGDGEFSSFNNNTFEDIGKNPLSIYHSSAHTIGIGNSFNAKPGYGIFIDGTNNDFDKAGDYTWLAHDAPYVLGGRLRLGSEVNSVNLTIAPGAVLKFADEAGIEVAFWDGYHARLIAEGTPQAPVIFTSNRAVPEKGDWMNLTFYPGSAGSSFKHCEILYAGSDGYYGALSLYDSGEFNVTIDNSRIAWSNSHAISSYHSSIDYSSVAFENNNGSDYFEF
jgi:hypothetical protein